MGEEVNRFAVDSADLASKIKDTKEGYFEFTLREGQFGLWKRSHWQYYAGLMRRGRILRGGDQGELSDISTNDYRNILQHIKVMATDTKPSWDVRSTNNDYESEAEAYLAPGLLDYYNRYGGMGKVHKRAAELSLIFGTSWIETRWNPNKGNFYGIDSSGSSPRPVQTGEIEYMAYGPMDAIYDISRRTPQDREPWVIFRESVNKYDLAAQYPEHADQIIQLQYEVNNLQELDDLYQASRYRYISDNIYVYTLYHDRTPSVPFGRYAKMCGDTILLCDEPLKYRRMPVHKICPSSVDKTNIGYTIGFDLLSLQRGADMLFSALLTNNLNFAVQNVMAMRGANIRPQMLYGGLNFIEYDSPLGKPEPLNLTASSPESYKLYDLLNGKMEVISAMNSTVRGKPPENLDSGAALAMMASQAIQFSSDFQAECVKALEEVGIQTLCVLEEEVSVERQVEIVGKTPGQLIRSYSGKQLSGIERVIVDVGNPIQRTPAGRAEMASQFLQYGAIKDVEKYIQVMNTGNLSDSVEGATLNRFRIKHENESMLKGEYVQPWMFENHPAHIAEHAAYASAPAVRDNPQLIQLFIQHIEEHMNLWRSAPPDILAVLGMVPPPPPMPMGMPPPGMPPDGGAPPEGAPQGGPPPQGGQPPPQGGKPPAEKAPMPPNMPPDMARKMPDMPKNPLTGQQMPAQG